MTIKEIRKVQSDKMSALFEKLGIFFAFSDEQFEVKRKEGVTYVHYYAGMLIPKENVALWVKESDRVSRETGEMLREHIPMDKYILHEMLDHEVFYTGSPSEILDNVQSCYPECSLEDINKVYRENYDRYA